MVTKNYPKFYKPISDLEILIKRELAGCLTQTLSEYLNTLTFCPLSEQSLIKFYIFE